MKLKLVHRSTLYPGLRYTPTKYGASILLVIMDYIIYVKV